MTDPIICLERLRVCYGSFVAVDELDLELRRGELFGLLGPNGAGKSTTLRVLIGQRRPSGGRVTVEGLDVAVLSDSVRWYHGWNLAGAAALSVLWASVATVLFRRYGWQ